MKFGGTSVGSASRMKEVVRLIADGERKIVVLSAMSGTTNKLVEISECLYDKRLREAAEMIDGLEAVYVGHVEELYSTDEYREKGRKIIKEHFDYLRSFVKDIFTLYEEKIVLAQGELISTKMVYNYMLEQGYDAAFLTALDFMRTDRLWAFLADSSKRLRVSWLWCWQPLPWGFSGTWRPRSRNFPLRIPRHNRRGCRWGICSTRWTASGC